MSEQYNSSDEKQVANAQRLAHNDTQAEINDLRATMRDVKGRNTIWRLLVRCGVYQSSFNVEHSIMSFQEGKKEVARHYLVMLDEHCFDEYQLMLNEQHELKTNKRKK